jgi:uncharacterized repeat protein (TIGR02543 family)
VDKTTCCVYVPAGAVAAYQAANGWEDFTCILEIGTTTVCTVTFDSQGGTYAASQTVAPGSRIAQPANPARTGYVFDGWYREAECINAWNFTTDVVTENLTLYAKWKSCDSSLAALSVSGSTLLPAFNAAVTSYICAVADNKSSVTLTATASHSGASVSGAGVKTLGIGEKTFDIVVTAEDGVTAKTYTVLVVRVPACTPDTVTVVRVDTVYITTPPTPTAAAKVEQVTLSVYPNPVTNGQLIVDNGQWNVGEAIEIYSMSGVLAATYATTGEKTSVNVSQLPNGTYLLRVGRYTAKFVKR